MRKKVVVLGANFAGLSAALDVKRALHGDVDVVVIAPRDSFLFTPSLIWLPFGLRDHGDISFRVEPTLDKHGVEFIHAAATGIDPDQHLVKLADGTDVGFDHLVVATGYRNEEEVFPGFRENTTTISTLADAERAATAWRDYLDRPRNVVVAASQGAACFGAAYEFLFNTAHQLRKAGLHRLVDLTFVSSEPFLGHFGIGGLPHGDHLLRRLLDKQRIEYRTNTAIDHIDDGAMVLDSGEVLPFGFSMVLPPFRGQRFLTEVDGLVDDNGFVTVRPTFQSEKYDDIYAAGAAVAVNAPWHTPVPVGVPKTGFPTERMAKVVAHNIASVIRGEPPAEELEYGAIKAMCVLDAGNNGVILLADRMLPPRRHGVLLPGPPAHLAKLAFEKYFLWKMRHGYVQLP